MTVPQALPALSLSTGRRDPGYDVGVLITLPTVLLVVDDKP
jgi:hypothetical protein